MTNKLRQLAQHTDGCARRLLGMSPAAKLRRRLERLRAAHTALRRALTRYVAQRRSHLDAAGLRLRAQSPIRALSDAKVRNAAASARLGRLMRRHMTQQAARLQTVTERLRSLGPTQTLERGYAIITDATTGRVVRSKEAVKAGTALHNRVADGLFESRVSESAEQAGGSK